MILVEVAKGMGDIRNTVIGVVLVLFVLLLPKGIAGLVSSRFMRLWMKSRKAKAAPDSPAEA
jgi:branched-chain amino acid transport system permease protein